MKKWLPIFIMLAIMAGCSNRTVERIEVEEQMDISGRWNDTDSRLVAEEMIHDVLTKPWRTNYIQKTGKKPTVIVGTVSNKTHEHINKETFIKDIEREFINSGRVAVVQSADMREELRTERAEQQDFASPETIKQWGREKGADFMMQGVVTSIVDAYKKESVVFYQVDLELTDIETNEKVWLGTKKIKKYIQD